MSKFLELNHTDPEWYRYTITGYIVIASLLTVALAALGTATGVF